MLITQTLRVMKLTAILLTFFAVHALAKTEAQTITYSGTNVPLKQILSVVKKQTGYLAVYNAAQVEATKPVTVNAKDEPLAKFLGEILTGQGLEFSIENKTIVISPKGKKSAPITEGVNPGLTLAADSLLNVHGKVVNEKGEPVAGVTVTLKGTKKATATDDKGEFALKAVDENGTLVFTSVNMETFEVKVNNKSSFELTLKAKTTALEEVTVQVNTGYQSISRERSAGSFSKPNMELMQNRSTSMNVLQRLDGLVPGLTINSAPGTDAVLIRGLNSVKANRSPLFVVDGISMNDISSINPQDVADITVLKDATAASIWGSRASNGVVVITTKKGGNSEKIKVNYDGFLSFQGKPDLHYLPVLSSPQFIQAAKDIFDPITNPWGTVTAYVNTGSTGLPPHDVILYNQYRGIISPAQGAKSLDSLSSLNNVDQIGDLWYRNASLMNHTISLSGGGKIHSFYGSLAYTNTQSNRPGEENKSYKVNLRQDFNISKWLQAYLITDLTSTNTFAPRNININNRFLPYQLFKDGSGNNLSMPYMGYLSDSTRMAFENRSRISLDYNPLNEYNLGYTKSGAFQSRMIGGFTAKLFSGLRFEGTYGYINGTNKTSSFNDQNSYLVRSELVQFTVAATPAATPAYYLPTTGGRYSVTNLSQTNWTVRNQLVYDYAWQNRKHQLVAIAGQEAQEQLAITNQSTVRGYNEMLQTYSAVDYATLNSPGVSNAVMPNYVSGRSTLGTDFFTKTEAQTRFTSYYANAAYTFNRKYSLNGSWRIDQSNLFGLDKSAQNKPVWSVGARWAISDEKFMKEISWLNRLALRGTYGITGNSPSPGSASSYDILSPLSTNLFPNGLGLQIATPGNTKLTWESTKTINIGLDFSVLRNRLNGSIDLYSKKTDNLIGNLAVNNFTGFSTITGNFGNLQNNGIEFSLSSLNIQSKNFAWQTILTCSFNKNLITQLNTASPITTGQLKIAQQYLTGYSAYAIFAYPYAGLDTLGDPMIHLINKTVTKAKNVATPDDVAYMGTYQPVWNGGVSNIFTYRNFSLGINIIYNLGHVMRRDVNTFYTGRLVSGPGLLVFTAGNTNAEFADRWKKPGDEASTLIPSYVSNSSLSTTRRETDYYVKGDVNVESASFVKIRDITLSYSLPKNLLNRIKTENISFRLQVSNVMLWKANKNGIDPEFQDPFNGTRSMPVNQGAITIGAHVTF
jgi:TonB-linked SusC/RagA family outer membrane protein